MPPQWELEDEAHAGPPTADVSVQTGVEVDTSLPWCSHCRGSRRPNHCYSAVKMIHAAGLGRLQDVIWFHNNRSGRGNSSKAMDAAAAGGHLEVVKWLHENRRERCRPNAMNDAAKNGHLEVVQFLHQHRPEGCTEKAMSGAAKNGHLAVVQFLHERQLQEITRKAIVGAAVHGHLAVIRWLFLNASAAVRDEVIQDERATVVVRAATNGYLEVLKFLYANGASGVVSTRAGLIQAAGCDQEAVVRWLLDYRCNECCSVVESNTTIGSKPPRTVPGVLLA
jgi:hypothetical protein